MMRTLPAKSAFTLIELLVVIAILALLIALLAPVLARARDSATGAKCTSNLRQIGSGLLLFASEHEGSFPIAGADIPHGSTDSTTQMPGWTEQLEPYLGKDLRIYRCESCGQLHQKNSTYSYFLGSHAAYLASGGFAAVKLQRIAHPSRFILGGDITADNFTLGDADKDDYTQNAAFDGDVSKLHNRAANILFADGSVRPYTKFTPGEMEISYDNPSATY